MSTKRIRGKILKREFLDELETTRRKLELSHEAIAEKTGLGIRTVSGIFRRENKDRTSIIALCNALGKSLRDEYIDLPMIEPHQVSLCTTIPLADNAQQAATVYAVLENKLRADFDDTPLSSFRKLRQARDHSFNQMVKASLMQETHSYRIIEEPQTASWEGKTDSLVIDLLKKSLSGSLKVNCPIVATGPIAVFKSLMKHHQIPIDIRYLDRNGRDQIKFIGLAEYDIVVTGNAAFFFGLKPNSAAKNYFPIFPCFHTTMCSYTKNTLNPTSFHKAYIFDKSIAESQARTPDTILSCSTHEECDPASILSIIDNMQEGEIMPVWSPLDNLFTVKGGFKKVAGSEYSIWHAVYIHERWLRSDMTIPLMCLTNAFISEWNWCRIHFDAALELLLSDNEFVSNFASAMYTPMR